MNKDFRTGWICLWRPPRSKLRDITSVVVRQFIRARSKARYDLTESGQWVINEWPKVIARGVFGRIERFSFITSDYFAGVPTE